MEKSEKKTTSLSPPLARLTPEQLRAATDIEGAIAIVATAGSGKTTTMASSIYNLIVSGAKEEKILATTFTRAAASELSQRISALLGRPHGAQAGTLHFFCSEVIEKNYEILGYPTPPSVIDDKDAKTLKTEALLSVYGVSALKALPAGVTLELLNKEIVDLDVRSFSDDKRDRDRGHLTAKVPRGVLEAARRYNDRLRRYGYLDYDKMLTEALRLLRTIEKRQDETKEGARERYGLPEYVFVDEAQDLSAIQWLFVAELTRHARLTAVIGDDDQSIYLWRGAMPWRFRHFVEKADRRHFLSANRRSIPPIVELASDVISAIPRERRIDKDLSAVRKEPSELEKNKGPSIEERLRLARGQGQGPSERGAFFLGGPAGRAQLKPKPGLNLVALPRLEAIGDLFSVMKEEVESQSSLGLDGKPLRYDDVAIICRSTPVLFPTIEGQLAVLGIPYQILGGKSGYETPEARLIKKIISLLLLAKGASEPRVHWGEVLPLLGLSPASVESLFTRKEAPGLSPGGPKKENDGAGLSGTASPPSAKGAKGGRVEISIEELRSSIENSRLSRDTKERISTFAAEIEALRPKNRYLKVDDILYSNVLMTTIDWLTERSAKLKIDELRRGAGGKSPLDEPSAFRRAVLEEQEDRTRRLDDMIFTPCRGLALARALSAMETLDRPRGDGHGDEAKREANGANLPYGLVTITTAHSSKGLEWRRVYVMEVNNFNWPSPGAALNSASAPADLRDEIIDEERRLLYVSITRAKDELLLLSSREDHRRGEKAEPSLFLPAGLRPRMRGLLAELEYRSSPVMLHAKPPFK